MIILVINKTIYNNGNINGKKEEIKGNYLFPRIFL